MKKFCIGFLILFTFCHLAPAQSAKVDLLEMETRIKAAPDSVLTALEDFVVLHPKELGNFVETAIIASKASSEPSRLRAIIELAVKLYPAKSAEVAEAAILAAPDQVETIREIFVRGNSEKPKSQLLPQETTPIPNEKYLATYRTSKPYETDDEANQALRAIDESLLKIKKSGAPFDQDAHGTVPEPSGHPKMEVFNVSIPAEDIEICSFFDPCIVDRVNESIEGSKEGGVLIDDAALERRLAESIRSESRPVLMETALAESKTISSREGDETVKTTWQSSVYPIPSPSNRNDSLALATLVIRGVPASQTTPQFRLR